MREDTTTRVLVTTFFPVAYFVVTVVRSSNVMSIVLNLLLMPRIISSILLHTSCSMAVDAAAVKPHRLREYFKLTRTEAKSPS